MLKKLYLSIEFFSLFAALPMLYCFDVNRFPMYPLLSVLPQEFLYRIFLFERYGVLFPGRLQMVLASAVVFSLLHGASFRG